MDDLQKFVEKVLIDNGLGDEDLNLISEYIVVMITNQKNAEQVTSEMCDLIGDRYTAKITNQIFDQMNKTNGGETKEEAQPAPQPQQITEEPSTHEFEAQPQQEEPSQPTSAAPSTKRSAADASLDDLIFGNKQGNQSNYKQNKRRYDNNTNNNNNNQTRHPRLDPATYKLSKELTTNFLESNPQLKKQYESYSYSDKTNFERQLLQQHFMTMQTAKVMQQQFEKMQQDAEEKAAQRLSGATASTRGGALSPARGGYRGRGSARGASRGSARGGFANRSATFGNQNKSTPVTLDKPLTDDAPKHKVWVRGATNQQQQQDQQPQPAAELPKSKKFTSDGTEKPKEEQNSQEQS